jgi:hypothetical protein
VLLSACKAMSPAPRSRCIVSFCLFICSSYCFFAPHCTCAHLGALVWTWCPGTLHSRGAMRRLCLSCNFHSFSDCSVASSNFATMKDGICISRRADRNFEALGPVRIIHHHWRDHQHNHIAHLSQHALTFLLQTLCAALNGVRLPSFPKHTVAVKYKVFGCAVVSES